ncbi:hypothetical protein [Agrobacterium rosae]|uniref:Uncharacterized protein n=1 Tax=Agrobacterium rosae TaxID=1972867 RepID=A0AAW9FHB5_9HYPH|nr:hypothetical protein [Agrobacterium rosae]MDX8306002.1 hypothetical protein [Agrobacterium rosae]
MSEPINDHFLATVSRAVTMWQVFYEVDPEDKVLDTLIRLARDHYGEGYQTSDDLATYLIGTYLGRWSVMMTNAPTSNSIH